MISIVFMMTLNLLIGLLLGLTPYISRRNYPFGISLPVTEETEATINEQKKSYFMINVGLSLLLSLGVTLISFMKPNLTEETAVMLSVVSMFIILIVSLISYVSKHSQLKKYKETLDLKEMQQQKVMIDLSFRDEKLIFPTSYLVALNLAFVLITVFITVINYQKIPETIVTQWDMNMNPSSVTTKSWGAVLAIPAMQVFITIVMAISNRSFLLAKQQIDGNNPAVSSAKNKRFRRQSSLLNFVISILTQLLFLAIQLVMIFDSISPKIVMFISIAFVVIIIGLVLWYSLYYGQSGERLKQVAVSSEDKKLTGKVVYEDNDQYWKLGMFYFNPDDPSFWVEKRMGVGVTFNLANWKGWVFIIGVLVLPLLVVFLMM